jgi:hypothetical protein
MYQIKAKQMITKTEKLIRLNDENVYDKSEKPEKWNIKKNSEKIIILKYLN